MKRFFISFSIFFLSVPLIVYMASSFTVGYWFEPNPMSWSGTGGEIGRFFLAIWFIFSILLSSLQEE